jgi:5-methylcytosine-specific restriction endonuclease McrA
MPRGFKRDQPITKMLRENGLLLDRRSFVAYDSNMTPHLLLKGQDIVFQRAKVWLRSRRKCGLCKLALDYDSLEMDHKKGGSFGRCDCLENLQILCRDCHRAKHVQVKLQSA